MRSSHDSPAVAWPCRPCSRTVTRRSDMSDLRNSLVRLREDVTAVPLPTAEAVRRHSDRARRRRAAALGASVVLAAAGAGALAVVTDRETPRQPAGGGS